MVRTYWLVQVFNEASWNLGLQPDRTDDQVESNFGPVLCEGMVAPAGQAALAPLAGVPDLSAVRQRDRGLVRPGDRHCRGGLQLSLLPEQLPAAAGETEDDLLGQIGRAHV